MKKLRFIRIFSVAIMVISISTFAFAQQLTRFIATIDQIDISRNGGRTWVTIHSGATDFNLIALSGGNAMQFANTSVPAGTYNKWRVHVTYYRATVEDGVAPNVDAVDEGPTDTWDDGDMNVVVDPGGNTSATWNFDAANSYTVIDAQTIQLDPQITIQ